MRAATVAALLASPEVVELVGQRVYERQGLEGGISNQGTPEAFGPEGDLLPSIVVVRGTRTAERTRGGAPAVIRAHQLIELWCYQQRGYDPLWEVVRRAARVLHRNRSLVPLHDPVNWLDTDWDSTSRESVDQDTGAAFILTTFDAIITDHLTAVPTP